MNDLSTMVRNCMRARLLDAQIVGEKQIQLPNAAFTKPTSGIWIRESINEGRMEPVSNAAAREFMVVNYEVFGKAAGGTAAVDATVAAISSGSPKRFIGIWVFKEASSKSWVMSVRTNPGATALTVTPLRATSCANAFVADITAPLAAE